MTATIDAAGVAMMSAGGNMMSATAAVTPGLYGPSPQPLSRKRERERIYLI
jgi:ribonuclease PH